MEDDKDIKAHGLPWCVLFEKFALIHIFTQDFEKGKGKPQ